MNKEYEHITLKDELCRKLFTWQTLYSPYDTNYKWNEYYWEDNKIVIKEVNIKDSKYGYFDGYSQVKWTYSRDYDFQVFNEEIYVYIFVADVKDGGLGLRYNKWSKEVIIFGIGEDDGFWSPSEYLPDNFDVWKGYLMSVVSEQHIEDFDHQYIIDKIWNEENIVKNLYI